MDGITFNALSFHLSISSIHGNIGMPMWVPFREVGVVFQKAVKGPKTIFVLTLREGAR